MEQLHDIYMLMLAWFIIVRLNCPLTSYNKAALRKSWEWWYEDLQRAKYIERAGRYAKLLDQAEVPPWVFPWTNMDTIENLEGFVWVMRIRWHGHAKLGLIIERLP